MTRRAVIVVDYEPTPSGRQLTTAEWGWLLREGGLEAECAGVVHDEPLGSAPDADAETVRRLRSHLERQGVKV